MDSALAVAGHLRWLLPSIQRYPTFHQLPLRHHVYRRVHSPFSCSPHKSEGLAEAAECIVNEDGKRQIACAISFHCEETYIGNEAKRQLVKNSAHTITGFRNLLGPQPTNRIRSISNQSGIRTYFYTGEKQIITIQATVASDHSVNAAGFNGLQKNLPKEFGESRRWSHVFITDNEGTAAKLGRKKYTIANEKGIPINVYTAVLDISLFQYDPEVLERSEVPQNEVGGIGMDIDAEGKQV